MRFDLPKKIGSNMDRLRHRRPEMARSSCRFDPDKVATGHEKRPNPLVLTPSANMHANFIVGNGMSRDGLVSDQASGGLRAADSPNSFRGKEGGEGPQGTISGSWNLHGTKIAKASTRKPRNTPSYGHHPPPSTESVSGVSRSRSR